MKGELTSWVGTALVAALPAGGMAQTHTSVAQMEKLSRGLVAVPADSLGIFVSWRLFGTDDDNTSFTLLRDGTTVKTNITASTNYVDSLGSSANEYSLITYQNGVAADTTENLKPWSNIYLSLPLDRPKGGVTPDGKEYTYTPNDCSVGDVDGDGDYEIILKWDPTNSKDNSHSGFSGNVLIDCYKLDGTKLWRIDLGMNIRAGAHYTQFMVYDFDGNGKAEMICKTAPGSMDAKGNYVNSMADDEAITLADNTKDWRNSVGRILEGPEYLTVFDGETGKAVHTIWYNPNREFGVGCAGTYSSDWGDNNGNRGDRFLAAVAYLDGAEANPSVVMCRGYYTRAFLWAVNFCNGKLQQRWLHDSFSKTNYCVTDYTELENGVKTFYTPAAATSGSGSNTAYANGNHNLSVADVDGDGKDEILWGACALDDDGTLLYATGFGHGDAIHVSDLIPDRKGLEVFDVHEARPYGWDLHDAATGEVLYNALGDRDNGRGLAADIDSGNKGVEFWSSNDKQIRSAATGEVVSAGNASINFRAYWNGDAYDELLNGNAMDTWTENGASRIYPLNGQNFYDIAGSSSCNGTKATPNLLADILGDWREELILWDSNDSAHINIFTTNVTCGFRVPTLMHDHVYRMGVAWQNVAYNQPPHLGYYLPENIGQTIREGSTHD